MSEATGNLQGQPIVVLGMFRSGTSCVASCFTKLGFYFGGDDELFPADEFNPGGYHEIKDLMTLNRRILGSFGMQHFRIEEIPSGWAEIPGSLSLLSEVERVLKLKLGGRPRWGWKEPQTSVLMPLYRKLFDSLELHPAYVICVRNPLDVCASQRTHSPLPHIGERVVGLWLHYTLSALRETKGAKRIVFHYDSYLDDPLPFLRRACQLLESDRPSDEAIQEAAREVRPEWRHFHRSEIELREWPAIVSNTYEVAKSCAQDPGGFQGGKFDSEIERLWLQWRRIREMVRTTAMPTGRFLLGWHENGKPRSEEVPMIPAGGWQTIKLPVTASIGTLLHIDPYQTPCILWIRKAVIWTKGVEHQADLRPGRSGMLSPMEGVRRLVVWGPDPMLLALPMEQVDEVEFEVLIQANLNTLNDIVNVLKSNLEFLVQKLNAAKRLS